ncbi:MAG: (E)-4-hydroxy-3-methylbut-2-enyl-diphosphate synthase [Cyclobacteriaceae bacterium]|jgi:(E)-4-hydroxy-3-methylbut-2-enyl-diphosphate synthase
MESDKKYCKNLTDYQRRESIEVHIGEVPMGGSNPIRIQSMTTVDTMDTQGSIDQSIRMINSGCEYVRITAPSIKEAQNLKPIRDGLKSLGYNTPLIADIHFTPNAAELAAGIVEKVRVNPGNYADKKKFENIEYTDESYAAELERIRLKFTPLVEICKKNGTAMRIGTNHGSLSDRIMSRFGDTPLGMVESALEFLRICESLNYYNIVLSMKSSNTRVMVQAYRLLVRKLDEEGLKAYPLHLGVTEAGEGEDGRIKSAVGIGTLLEDGIGDTVRVSLTEEPEFEAPVAQSLVDRYKNRQSHSEYNGSIDIPIDPYSYHKRETDEIVSIGGQNVPRVIADLSHLKEIGIKNLSDYGHFYLPEPDKWRMNETGADFIYTGENPVSFMLPNGLKEVINYNIWLKLDDREHKYPFLSNEQFDAVSEMDSELIFVEICAGNIEFIERLKHVSNVVLVLSTKKEHAMASMRRFVFELIKNGIKVPVIIKRLYNDLSEEQFQLYAATDMGGLLIDGLGDGVMLSYQNNGIGQTKIANNTAFGVLQAARTRMTKTEYISCPSCGRTLFDLQETTAMIRKRTDHLKGVKIGIMGCIVNGPGEMADADYGYVGSGKGKITLYKGQEVIKRAVPSENAVDELIEIIKGDGTWVEPEVQLEG